MKNFQNVFNSELEIYLDLFDKIICEIKSINYDYVYIEEYSIQLENDVSEGHKIYWTEIINNAHSASLMSMYRHKHWITGIIDSFNNENYLTFCANLRGLLESVSDSNYSLNKVPEFIKQYSHDIEKAIKKQDEFHSNSTEDFQFITCSKLEEILLHFTFARKLRKNEVEPKYHNAETNTKYINTLGDNIFLNLYSDLCQITHPAMPSVMDYFNVTDKINGYNNRMDFLSNKNQELIKILIDKYKEQLNSLLIIGFNYPLAILKEINKLNIEQFNINILDDIIL